MRFLVVLALLVPTVSFAQSPALWTATDVETTVVLDTPLLEELGFLIDSETPSATPRTFDLMPFEVTSRVMAFTAPRPYSIAFTAPGNTFGSLVGSDLTHSGGFILRHQGDTIDARNFRIHQTEVADRLQLLDANGVVLFDLDHAHSALDLDAGRLMLFNVDMRIAAPLAERLNRPELTGVSIGAIGLDATLDTTAPEPLTRGGCSTPNFDLITDVALTDVSNLQQSHRDGGRVALTPSATLENVGTADVKWYEFFTPSDDQHPYLVWALYRLDDGVFEMIGQSAVKHAFYTINSGCSCPGGHILWAVGCRDTYGTGTNSSRSWLAPRDEITASTGEWARCGSYWDQDCNGEQDNRNPIDGFDRRMVVEESDLQDADARYFVEAWYIIQNDVDIFNTMGWREVDPTFTSSWSFPTLTDPMPLGPAINAWVPDDATLGANGALNRTLTVGDEGHVQLVVETTDLGGGLTRYQYGLMNHDFDRQIDSFSIPLPNGATVSNVTFGDIDQDGGNDWSFAEGANALTWTAPAGNSLDWGTLFVFGFTVDSAPVDSSADLGVLEPGTPGVLTIGTLAPTTAGPIFTDGFESGDTVSWSATIN
ncbi:MAG: hypothetical protein AAGD38_15255 [Acidobacteriota bacterium]